MPLHLHNVERYLHLVHKIGRMQETAMEVLPTKKSILISYHRMAIIDVFALTGEMFTFYCFTNCFLRSVRSQYDDPLVLLRTAFFLTIMQVR
jgi:hypothetical protein